MGHNVTKREDGSYHVEDDGSGCGCLIGGLFIVGAIIFILGAATGFESWWICGPFAILFLLLGIWIIEKTND
jgi:hypothetical protein